MKTLHLGIITGSGIVITIILGMSYFFPFTTPQAINIGTNDLDSSSQITKNFMTDTKNDNTFGVTALVKYTPYDACLGFSCSPYTYYLKMNSNSTAYLLGYDICGADLCVKKDGLSILLPLRDPLAPNYTAIGLDANSKWNYGDTTDITLYLGATPNGTIVHVLNIKNSVIVP